MSETWRPEFIWAACQHGANTALKHDVAKRMPDCKPAFARPGFVTFKLDPPASDLQLYGRLSPLARRVCFSLGSVQGEDATQLSSQVWSLPQVAAWLDGRKLGGLHVWQRDQHAPGDHGFEPGASPLSQEVRLTLLDAAAKCDTFNAAAIESESCRRNRWIVDIMLVEPNEWWIGCHIATSRSACWPGGVPAIEAPEDMISRAYLKMAEALSWSALPIARGEAVLELGCAPGGAAQALLDAGAAVIGVDPAEVDPLVAEHPRFTHIRRRTTQLPNKLIQTARWLAADMNVAPSYTLDAVEDVVRQQKVAIRGLLLTCKLSNWALLDETDAWVERIRSWGYQDVRLRQLAHNRQELCIAALRSRSQRRIVRPVRRKQRTDDKHAGTPTPHLPSV